MNGPTVQQMDWSDLEISRQLGQGGFCTVYNVGLHPSVSVRSPPRSAFVSSLSGKQQNKLTMSNHETQIEDFDDFDNDREYLYAAKTLSRFVKGGDKELRQLAIQDLRREVSLLSKLPFHPNIVSLVGVSNNFEKSPESGFLLLEKVTETLDAALLRWKHEAKCKSIVHQLIASKRQAFQAETIERVALGIADAMVFLHSNNIVYRDLKPSNLGFDRYGRIQIFDFGLARQLESTEPMLLTYCGTPRYMSPEVVRREACGLSIDVYTFGLVLWELLAFKKPYRSISNENTLFLRKMNNHTLPLRSIASCRIRQLLQQCWKSNPHQRPNFRTIHDQLSAEIDFWVAKKNLVKKIKI